MDTCASICDALATDGLTAEKASCWRTGVGGLADGVAECDLSGATCAECLMTNGITDAQCSERLAACDGGGEMMVGDDFGEECFAADGCNGDSPDWPDCLDVQCETGNCQFPVFTRDYGFCTRDCTESFECNNAFAGPYGSEFVCMTDGTSGICSPGSNDRCDRAQNGMCDDENETCKFALLFAPDGTYGSSCQPKTPNGRAVGESCDEEAGIFCENDMCLYGICTAICDPAADPSRCPAGYACFEDWTPFNNSATITVDMCLPQYCEVDADCESDDFICTLGFDFNASNVLRGICVPFEEGKARAGEECNDDTRCAAAACFDGYCGGLCNSDDDCPNDDYCSIVNFSINAEPGSAPAQVCQPGTGSGRMCSTNNDCAADEANQIPAEACEYVVRGNLDGGIPTEELTVTGRCTSIPGGAVGFGEVCGQLAPCTNEGLCLSANGNFCAEPCRDTGDCQEGALCFGLGITNELEGGVCVPGARFSLDGSSFDACRSDNECIDGEHCRLNIIGSSDPVAERFCVVNEGDGALASQCDANDDCKSGACFPRSTDLMEAGYCFGPCGNDADCGEGFGCARQVMHAGSGVQAKVCRPIDVCGPCALDNTMVCGGELVCTHLVYEGVGPGEACLTACEGMEDDSCAEGSTCAPHRGLNGVVTEGEFVCTPAAPATTCGAAMPR